MPSLTTHLRAGDGHDRLRFEASCPICRATRLNGAVAAGPVISTRAQALLSAGLLAISASAPAPGALAAEPDQQQDGAAPVAQAEPPDPAANPDFDPGGSATDLAAAGPPVSSPGSPAAPGAADAAPVDHAPTTDPADPVADPGDGSDAASATSPASADTGAAPAPTTAAPPPAPGPPEVTERATPALSPSTAAAPVPTPAVVEHTTHRPRTSRQARAPEVNVAKTAPTVAATPTAPAPRAAPPAAQPPAPVVPADDRARPGDRTHIVVAGESLWAIASDLLGPGASPARTAREVHRLWQLNHDRIATGDPDLLMIATKLVLR